MKINKITPQGYCSGVERALKMVDQALENKTLPQPIHLLGAIIHNHFVIEKLKQKGVLLIEDKTKSREELLDQIHTGTVIISAHGVAPSVIDKAKSKGLHILDSTCGNVLIVHHKMKEYLNQGYACIYLGTKNHPECEGVLGIDPRIQLLQSVEDISHLIISTDKIYITNQTTMSILETKMIYEVIKNQFPSIIIDDRICTATTVRQLAVQQQEPVDLCLIVGDAASSNTKKLKDIALSAGIPATHVESLADVKTMDFSKISTISITSGASTPDYLVDEIIAYLRNV